MGKRFHCVRDGTLDPQPPNRQVLLGSSSLGELRFLKAHLEAFTTFVCDPGMHPCRRLLCDQEV